MNKLEQAARQALEALIKANHFHDYEDEITALREALAEQATVSDGLCGGCAKKAADGWALYCVECWEKAEPEQYPTYGFCPICGSRGISRERRINGNDTCANGHSYASNLALHIAPEKKAEQEPVLWGDDKFAPHERPQKPKECADGCPPLQVCDHCQTAEQAEQEPVGYQIRVRPHGAKWLDWKDCSKSEYEKVFSKPSAKYHDYDARKLYAAPVQQIDLTDDEIMKINVDTASIVPTCDRQFHFARAVIAADRAKNGS